MILNRILDVLKSQQMAGLSEIASAVDSSPDAVRSMLDTLQRKGLVHRYQPSPGCGTSCRQCAQSEVEYYCLGRPSEPTLSGVSCRVEQKRS